MTDSAISNLLRPAARGMFDQPWDYSRHANLIELQFGEIQEDVSPKVRQAMIDSIGNIGCYTGLVNHTSARIAEYNGLPAENVAVMSGSDQAFLFLSMMFIEPGDELLYAVPGYSAMKPGVRVLGGNTVPLRLTEDYRLPPIEMIRALVTERTKFIYFANPNVPAGNLIATRAQIEAILKLGPIVIVDEAYVELSGFTVADLIHTYDNLVINRTLSKTHGMAGLRVSYLVAAPELAGRVAYMKESTDPFVSSTSLAAALAALEDRAHFDTVAAKIAQARSLMTAGLRELGLHVPDSLTTAILADVAPLGMDAEEAVARLFAAGVRTKGCVVYDYSEPGWVFIGVPRLDQTKTVLDAIRKGWG